MQIHITAPYRLDKDLGLAYNEFMKLLPDDDFACFIDYDVMLLTHDAGAILHGYAERFPDALLTCFTNRISPLAKPQLFNGIVNDDGDIKHHIAIAELQKSRLYIATEINQDISGFLMLLSKRTWLKHRFQERGKPLGVDTYYGRQIRAAGVKILRCDGLYVWHTYRLTNGINYKGHLKV